jgi:hypothetical protein
MARYYEESHVSLRRSASIGQECTDFRPSTPPARRPPVATLSPALARRVLVLTFSRSTTRRTNLTASNCQTPGDYWGVWKLQVRDRPSVRCCPALRP